MQGLEQVADDEDCLDGPDEDPSGSPYEAVRNRFFRPARQDRLSRLARTIEGELIPRLMLVHRSEARALPAVVHPAALGPETIERLAGIVVDDDVPAALTVIQSLLAGGLSLEEVYLEVLAPVARRLGSLWLDDRISFSDVTIGLSRLQRVMRTLAQGNDSRARAGQRSGRVMLAAVPGEQHSFGVLMLEEFFRRDGWDVECATGASNDALVAAAKRTPDLAAVGLSISVDTRLAELEALIHQLRNSVKNRDLIVMVGGRCFNDAPELAKMVGADLTAVDGRQAISQIHSMLSAGSNGG